MYIKNYLDDNKIQFLKIRAEILLEEINLKMLNRDTVLHDSMFIQEESKLLNVIFSYSFRRLINIKKTLIRRKYVF